MMNQPKWKLVANMGDVNFADYGGALVYEDETGVYEPELEFYNSNDNETGGTVYRFILETVYYTDGILSDNKFHLDYPVWWSEEPQFTSLLNAMDITRDDFISKITGNNIVERARMYLGLAYSNGFFEFDQYPIRLSEAEAQERYKDVK